MISEGTALKLTIFLSEDASWKHRPMYTEIVHRAHQAGLAGASVFRGIEGFGAGSHIHTARLLSLAESLPAVVVIVDEETRLRAFLPELNELAIEGLMYTEPVSLVRYGRPRS